jgi:predicted acylesterase/phospholipase RssA
MLKLSILFVSAVSCLQDSCITATFSGGGSFGAYEAGSIWGVVNGHLQQGHPEKSMYDSVVGISTGAFNSLGVSVFAKGDELNMVNWLSDLWHNLRTRDVYKNWPIPIIELRWKTGVFDDSPLFNTINTIFSKVFPIKRLWKIGSVDFNSGSFVTFNETEPDIVKAVISSGSIPLAFPR